MTFNQDVNVTVTTPSGTTKNFTLPPEVPPFFTGAMTVYVGDQPNAGANVGQTVVLSRFQIKNGDTPLLDITS